MKRELLSQDCCRLCASPATNEMIDLKNPSNFFAEAETIRDRVKSVYDIEILPSDILPTSICLSCEGILTTFFMAKEMVKVAQRLLSSNIPIRRFLSHTLNRRPQVTEANRHGSEAGGTDPAIEIETIPSQSTEHRERPSSPDLLLERTETDVSDTASVVSSRKRPRTSWVTEITSPKNIGTTIDPTNILPETNRREKRRTAVAEISDWDRAKRRALKKKGRPKGSKNRPKLKDVTSWNVTGPVSVTTPCQNDNIQTEITGEDKKTGTKNPPTESDQPLELEEVEHPTEPTATANDIMESSDMPTVPIAVAASSDVFQVPSANERRASSSGRIIKPSTKLIGSVLH